MNELNIINEFFRPIATSQGAMNLQDDCGYFAPNYVISCDAMVENIHFLSNATGAQIANRLMAMNCSDIISSGAKPLYIMLSVYYTDKQDADFWRLFTQNLTIWRDKCQIHILGGNCIKGNDKFQCHLTMIGTLVGKNRLSRTNAQIGDYLIHTGYIGDGHLGLCALKNQDFLPQDLALSAISSFFNPNLYWEFAHEMAKNAISHAAMDISDGLLLDATRFAKASDCSINCDISHAQFSPIGQYVITKGLKSAQELASAGDDYQYLWAVNPNMLDKFTDLAHKFNVPFGILGKFQPLSLKNQNLNSQLGYIHD